MIDTWVKAWWNPNTSLIKHNSYVGVRIDHQYVLA